MNRGLRDKGGIPRSCLLVQRRSGSVLITVIWILGILVVFTLAVHHRASQHLVLGRWMKERVLGRALAKAGVERAIFEIQEDDFLTFDAPSEKWGFHPESFENVKLGPGIYSVECPVYRKGQETVYRFGVCDESARINVNTATESILENLLQMTNSRLEEGKAKEIAQSIMDWRDADDSVMEYGAEASYYRSISHPYEPRNGPLESIEELLMVRSIDAEIFESIKPYVTIYSDGKINFNSAPAIVLEILGMSGELAVKIVTFRWGEDLIEGTEDDQVFQIVEGITPALSAVVSFSSDEFAQVANLISQERVSVKTDTFRIYSFGRLLRNDKIMEESVICIVKRNGVIQYWREGVG